MPSVVVVDAPESGRRYVQMVDLEECVVRVAEPEDAGEAARLLHDFNTEFGVPSPGAAVLERRLRSLLRSSTTFAIVAGRPAVAIALVTVRSNVWYEGSVALLDELYVVPPLRGHGIGSAVMNELHSIARAGTIELIEVNVDEADTDAARFYERHGYVGVEPMTGGRAFYFSRELPG